MAMPGVFRRFPSAAERQGLEIDQDCVENKKPGSGRALMRFDGARDQNLMPPPTRAVLIETSGRLPPLAKVTP